MPVVSGCKVAAGVGIGRPVAVGASAIRGLLTSTNTVGVRAGSGVSVPVAVGSGVAVLVAVGVEVGVSVGVSVGVTVDVLVEVGVGVAVAVGGIMSSPGMGDTIVSGGIVGTARFRIKPSIANEPTVKPAIDSIRTIIAYASSAVGYWRSA